MMAYQSCSVPNDWKYANQAIQLKSLITQPYSDRRRMSGYLAIPRHTRTMCNRMVGWLHRADGSLIRLERKLRQFANQVQWQQQEKRNDATTR